VCSGALQGGLRMPAVSKQGRRLASALLSLLGRRRTAQPVRYAYGQLFMTAAGPPAEVGLVSSSLDGTLCLLDLSCARLAATVALHRKGVRCFGYSPAFSLVARCVCACVRVCV
jgi:hypothetical protein